MTKYTLPDFFEALLIPDLEKMVAAGLHYYAFTLICQGIEVMGASFDTHALEAPRQSENRFTIGLAKFFKDARYRNNQTKFFSLLRGPLIHQLRPGEAFFLASAKKDGIDEGCHLKQHESGSTLLIIEPFLADFRDAFRRFKAHLEESRAPVPERFYDTFIAVSPIELKYGHSKWDPEMERVITMTPSVTGSQYEAPSYNPSSPD